MIIASILFLSLILRLISLNQSLWLDEAINILAAKNYSLLGMITQYAQADFHPPGFFMIIWIWGKIFGYSEVVMRIPSVIFGVLTVYAVYLLGNKLYSKTLGLLSALLLAVNPLHVFYSQEARMYSLAALAVVLNFFLLVKLLRGEKGNLLLLIISNLLILSSDYVAYFAFPAQLLFLLILKQKKILIIWFKGLTFAILLGIWWTPIFISQLNVGSVASADLPTWKFVVGGFDIKTTALTLVKFIIGRMSLNDKIIYYSLLLPVCALFLFILVRGIKFIKESTRNLLICWLLVPIILATVISFIIPIYSYFRMLFVLPAFVILIVLGVISYKSKLRYFLFTSVFLVQLFSSGVYLFNPFYQREDWRGMVNYLKSIDKNSQVLFESSGTLPPFDYYAKNRINARGALKDFPARNDSDVTDFIGINIYLVDYLVQISDPDRLVAKKLENLGLKLTDIQNFTGVGFVYHYVKE